MNSGHHVVQVPGPRASQSAAVEKRAKTSAGSRSLRVLHVIPGVAPRYGGPSKAVFQMCRALTARGVECTIATTDADGKRHLPVAIGAIHDYERVPTIFFHRTWGEGLKYSRGLARWLSKGVRGFDLVHIHAVFSHSSLSAARACRREKVPYIVRPLGSLDPWSLAQKRVRKRVLWKLGVGRMLQKASAIHYTCLEEKRHAEAHLALARGEVIPLGVDEDLLGLASSVGARNEPSHIGDHPYVLTLGRLHPKKGLETLIDAFLELSCTDAFRKWRLVVAGDGSPAYVNALRSRTRQLDGSGSVVFSGWLEGVEKHSALRGAALVALISHQENFGLSIVEALALGRPVLVSDRVNLAHEISAAGAGWIVPPSKGPVRDALAYILMSGEERGQKGAAGQKWVLGDLRWDKVAARLRITYETVLASGPQ